MQPRGKYCVILNESAGDATDAAERLEQLDRDLTAYGIQADLRAVTGGATDPGHVARQAVQDGYGALIAAGGDGTVAAVAAEAYRADTPMGVLPLGTFNFFARSLGIPEDADGAMKVLARGRHRRVDPGLMNGRLFLNNASIGLYPSILEQREGIYARWGRSRLAAYGSVLSVLLGRHRPMRLRITGDGETVERRTSLAFICNSAYQLREYGLEADDEIAAGKFALLTSRRTDRGSLLRSAWRLARGKARRAEDFDVIYARELLIQPQGGRCLAALDGEKRETTTPIRFLKAPRGLSVIAPEKAAAPA